MPKVGTLSVFLPALSSSSAVCAQPSPHHANSTSARIFFMAFSSNGSRLLRHQRERPHHAAGGHTVGDKAPRDTAAAARQHGYVLLAFVRVSDWRRIDRRAGLELPQLLAVVLVERDDFAGELAGEQQAAVGCEH